MKIKKLTLLLVCAAALAACAGNKNILNEKMAKYPADKYITKIAAGADKNAAKEAAVKDLRTFFDGRIVGASYFGVYFYIKEGSVIGRSESEKPAFVKSA